MAQTLLNIAADFDTQLTDPVAIGDTTTTIATVTDDDGNTIPNGLYGFTVDAGNASKEYIIATVTSTALSNVISINRQGNTTVGFVRPHRRGAKITITDWAILSRILKNLDGTTGFNSLVKLGYDADPSITSSDLNKFATVKFVNDTAIAGAPDATTATKGITRLSTAPVSPTAPIAVGDNDTRVPTQAENDALAGTNGTPSGANPFVTSTDVVEAATASRIPRRRSTGDITVPTTPTASTDAASKAYVDSFNGISVPLGEAFTGATTPQPCVLVNDLWQSSTQGAVSMGVASSFSAQRGQRFTLRVITRANVTSNTINVPIGKFGNPLDNVFIEIQTDSSGAPSGTVITNGTSGNVSGGSLPIGNGLYQTFTFSSAFTLNANTTYWVVLRRSGSGDDSNYYFIASTNGGTSGRASFLGSYFNGSSWVSGGELMAIEIIPTSGSGSYSLWQSDADGAFQGFEGFCTTTGNAGDSGFFVQEGNVAISSLIPFADYYLSTTKGQITTTAQGQYVGTAVSSTSLKLSSVKKGQIISLGNNIAGSLSVNGISQFRLKSFYNGDLFFNSSNAGTLTITVSDAANFATSETYNLQIPPTAQLLTSFPIRKGQYFLVNSTTSGVAARLVPDYQ